MTSRRNHWVGLAATALAAVLYVASLFPHVLSDPDNYLYNDAGDGLKTYFVSAYYVKYDSGHHFTGMNYPVGEHVNYPDMQPIITGVLGLINQHVYPISDHTIGIMNVLLLLSMMLTPVIMYAILRRLRLPVAYAVLTALLIGFLAPQHGRIDGHMTLSFTPFVPLLWYCIIRMLTTPRRVLWHVLFGAACVMMGMVTPYYTAVGSFFLLAHVVVLAWQQPRRTPAERRAYWGLLGRLVFTALAPLVVFRIWLWATDPTLDRPINPYGFFEYIASFTSVFIPVEPPLHEPFKQLLGIEEPVWEGWAYVGLASTLVLIITLVRAVRYALRRRGRLIFRPALPQPLRVSLWAAALLLLLAMCYPFKLPGLRALADVFPPLRQFRSLGRFAWPFYYVFTSYAAYTLYLVFRAVRRRTHRPALAYALLAPVLALWAVEANWHMHFKADEVEQRATGRLFTADAGNYTELLTWGNRKPSDFQALLPLPYYTLGTDVFQLDGSGDAVSQSYRASLNTGLPLLTVFLARASVGQTMDLIQLLSSPLLPKAIIPKFPSRKPLLLLVAPGPISAAEQRIIDMSHKITTNGNITLYELPLEALEATSIAREQARADSLLPTLRAVNGVYSSTGRSVLLEQFNGRTAPHSRLQPGAFYEPENKFSQLYNGPIPAAADTGQYEASVWVNAKMWHGVGNMQIKVYRGDELIEHKVQGASQSTELDGDWARVAVPFRIKAGATRMEVLYESQELVADDLLIRPLDTDAYYYITTPDKKRQLIKNGYRLQ
ncbi:hypothetical protein [Hymenobacter rigui]|uniref:DUF6311 domain-containing protein n=1 Tax=Hymenobacter rigui TaxID=334424 RepID=A0A3R9MN19_9BACT|nr:hypothetical protein [Hymenobacter rigui]RSK49596.1 hypothetical protein EI291_08900 [Hymenobacter rigui]